MEAGTYTGRATRWAWDTTRDGSMCLRVAIQVAGEIVRGTLYFDTDREDTKGRTAADRSMEVLRAMGLRGGLDTITDEGGGGLDQGEVSVVVEIDRGGYCVAKYINAPQVVRAFSAPSPDAKRAFFAQMNPRLEQPAPTRGFAPTPAQDDDIPF